MDDNSPPELAVGVYNLLACAISGATVTAGVPNWEVSSSKKTAVTLTLTPLSATSELAPHRWEWFRAPMSPKGTAVSAIQLRFSTMPCTVEYEPSCWQDLPCLSLLDRPLHSLTSAAGAKMLFQPAAPLALLASPQSIFVGETLDADIIIQAGNDAPLCGATLTIRVSSWL